MNATVTKKPKNTLELQIVVPSADVKKAYDRKLGELAQSVTVAGFRQGQAPIDLVEKQLDMQKVMGDVLNDLLQTYYPQALKENHIAPIGNPSIDIKTFDLASDLEFTATVATIPPVKVGDYKAELKKTKTQKEQELKALNAERLKKGDKIEQDHIHLTADDVLDAILAVTEVELADILIADETNRMLTRLVDQAHSVGLSLEQYLQSQGKSKDDLRAEYDAISVRNLTAEFALAHLIKELNIEVSDTEIDQTIAAAGDEKTKAMLNTPAQRMYIKNILTKNKVLSQITAEAEGYNENHQHAANDTINQVAENKKEDQK